MAAPTTTIWGDEPRRDAGDERSLGDLIDVLRRRAGLVLAVAGVVVALAFAYAMTATRYYNASSVVLLEPRSSLSQADSVRFSFASDSALVDSQMKLLSSETVLRRVVEREDLLEDPEFGQPAGGLWASLRRMMGLGRPEAEEAEEKRTATIEALALATTVKRPERTYVMEVTVSSRDPRRAARLANAIAEAYIADQTDARSDISRREQGFLEGGIADARRKIEAAENAVEAYKQRNQIIGASGKLVNEQQLGEINTALGAARTRVGEARARHDQVRRILASGRSVESLPDALKSPVIDRLRTQIAEIVRQEANAKTTLGTMHPQYREVQQQLRDTRRLIGDELSRIAEGAQTDLRIAEANERALSGQVEQLKRESSSMNQSIVQLRELEREVETNRAVLDSLLRAKGSVTRDSGEMPIARIIARAAPPLSPSSPRRTPIMLIAAAFGVALGAFAAFGAEGAADLRRRRERTGRPAPLAAAMDAPAAAPPASAAETPLVAPPPTSAPPESPAAAAAAAPPPAVAAPTERAPVLTLPAAAAADRAFTAVMDDPDEPYSVAVRELALRIPPRGGPDEPATCLVAACGAGAGAAPLAANLAQACAGAGRRTLLIELSETAGDLARGWTRDLPLGLLEMSGGEVALGVVVADSETRRLVVAPGSYRRRPAGAAANDALPSLGRAVDFDVIVGYAPDAGLLREPAEAAAGAGLLVVAVADDARLTRPQRDWIERMVDAAGGRAAVAALAA